jgi:hypothetical protein
MGEKHMVSKDPFNFNSASFIPPIVCTTCGSNMHCIRRVPGKAGELHTFECICGNVATREPKSQESDAAIQEAVEERITGGSI